MVSSSSSLALTRLQMTVTASTSSCTCSRAACTSKGFTSVRLRSLAAVICRWRSITSASSACLSRKTHHIARQMGAAGLMAEKSKFSSRC